MSRDWVVTATAEVFAAVLGLIFERQSRRSANADLADGDGGRVVRYGVGSRLISLICFAGSGGGLVMALARCGLRDRQVLTAVGFLGMFALLSGYASVVTLGSRLTLGRRAIISHSPWRLPHELAWSEIASVTYSKWLTRFEIRGPRGEKIRVSRDSSGVVAFADLCRDRLPYRVYEGAYHAFGEIDKLRDC